jgi:flagellar basal body-associated protein FliL
MSKKLIVIIVIALVVLGGTAAGAYWWMTKTGDPEAATEAKAEDHGPGGLIPFEPFVVNLADTEASRFLRVSMKLVVGAEHAKELEHDEVMLMRARSSILELLTEQTAGRLVTADGKAELKKAIIERASTILHDVPVIDVLFTDFVVQF